MSNSDPVNYALETQKSSDPVLFWDEKWLTYDAQSPPYYGKQVIINIKEEKQTKTLHFPRGSAFLPAVILASSIGVGTVGSPIHASLASVGFALAGTISLVDSVEIEVNGVSVSEKSSFLSVYRWDKILLE